MDTLRLCVRVLLGRCDACVLFTHVQTLPTWVVSAPFAVRVRGVTQPEAFSKPTVMKQEIFQTCGGGVHVVITRVTCSADACVHGHGASSG